MELNRNNNRNVQHRVFSCTGGWWMHIPSASTLQSWPARKSRRSNCTSKARNSFSTDNTRISKSYRQRERREDEASTIILRCCVKNCAFSFVFFTLLHKQLSELKVCLFFALSYMHTHMRDCVKGSWYYILCKKRVKTKGNAPSILKVACPSFSCFPWRDNKPNHVCVMWYDVMWW